MKISLARLKLMLRFFMSFVINKKNNFVCRNNFIYLKYVTENICKRASKNNKISKFISKFVYTAQMSKKKTPN